jgi:radical SAM superfamily enzyme YgiQ (UPF0313 family)
MKLVLIQPPIQDFYDTAIRLQPLGLACLKAAVKKSLPHWQVVIKDFHHGRGRRTIPWPSELSYLKDYYPWPDRSPFSLFHHYYHFGTSFEDLAEEVIRESPDLIGISSLFTPYYREVLGCAEAIKKRMKVPIVLGGSHVSVEPEVMVRHPDVDWVIRGEGEEPLIELLKAHEKGQGVGQIPGLGYKQDGRVILNSVRGPLSLESLPFPDFDDFEPGNYLYEKRPLCFLMTSRGCPRRCTFCSVHQTFPDYRKRSVESVLSEMSRRYDQGYRVFDFEDDNLTYDQEAFRNLCLGIKSTFPPGSIECLAMNGIAYPSLTPELLPSMKEAGFTHLNISLVSYDRKVREKTGRAPGLDRYLAVVSQAFRLGFKTVSYQILGLPEESLDSMVRTVQFQAGLPVLLGPSPYYATPGTLLSRKFPEPTESDLLKSRLTALAIESEGCRREDLYTLFVTTRIINFFKGLTLPEDEITLPRALTRAMDQGKRSVLGAEIFEKLWIEGVLYGAAPDCLRKLPRFNARLFFTLWSGLDYIQTLEGKTIRIP